MEYIPKLTDKEIQEVSRFFVDGYKKDKEEDRQGK